MRKTDAKRSTDDDLDIPPLTEEFFKTAVMGKYYRDVMARSNVVRIHKDLNDAFPNEAAVNEALRQLLTLRETLNAIVANPKRKKTA